MTDGLWHKLDQTGRNLAPFAITAMMMLAGMVPLRLPGYGPVAPLLGLMAIFYWSVHRPDLLRPGAAFFLGMLHDLLSATPFGTTALVYVLVYWVVLAQRRSFLATSFAMLWVGFAPIVFGAAAVLWVCASLLQMTLLPVGAVLIQSLLTLALFPVFAWLLIRIHRAFLQV